MLSFYTLFSAFFITIGVLFTIVALVIFALGHIEFFIYTLGLFFRICTGEIRIEEETTFIEEDAVREILLELMEELDQEKDKLDEDADDS